MNQSMSDTPNTPNDKQNIVIHNHPTPQPWFSRMFWRWALIMSVIANISLWGALQAYQPSSASEKFVSGEAAASDKIAIIKVADMITGESVKTPIKELESAAKDDAIKAIILSVNSPGGTVSGSDQLYHAVEEYKRKTSKPVVVHMHGIATSGAYYISAPADHIVAEQTCVTGSIGVIATLFEATELLNDRLGVTVHSIKSGLMKDSGSPFKKLTDEEKKEWQELIDGMYGRFLAIILKYRDNALGGEEKLRELANGRVFLATEAVKVGLVDSLGYEEDALAKAKSLAGLSEDTKVKVIGYSRAPDWAELLEMKSAASNVTSSGLGMSADRLLSLQTPRLMMLPPSFIFAQQ